MATTDATMTIMKTFIGRQRRPQADAIDFDELYRENVRPVFAFVAYRLNDRHAAEDVMAQVFEKAWRSRERYDSHRGGASPWLFTIARNCVIDHIRAQQRRRETPTDRLPGSDQAAGPEEEFENRETRQAILWALDQLEQREHEIIALKFGGGMSNGDIAAVLKLTPTNVSTILYRSLDKLNSKLEGGIDHD